MDTPVDHERSYRGFSPRAFLHRARLGCILKMLGPASRLPAGRLADFGCSNGFVLGVLSAGPFPHPQWELWGFDHAPRYLDDARGRRIAGARFAPFDLDAADAIPPGLFDVVLCLETLEHTGNYRVGLGVLARATRPGGLLVISVPNEVGLAGLIKFFARRVVRPRTYDGFFRGRPQGPYVRALLRGENLESFRQPPRHGWADHLGFDIRRFESSLHELLIKNGSFELLRKRRVAAGFGRVYQLRRSGRPPMRSSPARS